MENLGYLFAGYAVVWLLLFGYMFSIAKRQKQLEKEIELLKDLKSEN
ncbi:MAG: CcmD family protein [candidate division KSB1 bacterium]|nr:CcmD family protein [candidate division KSB1 bacterium]MDQ7063481.1 CcmD family protein [candidate division KSB1 bacterium]